MTTEAKTVDAPKTEPKALTEAQYARAKELRWESDAALELRSARLRRFVNAALMMDRGDSDATLEAQLDWIAELLGAAMRAVRANDIARRRSSDANKGDFPF